MISTVSEIEARFLEHFDLQDRRKSNEELARDAAGIAISVIRTYHSKALACHCQCLGMNAANSMAVCLGINVPYDESHYDQVLQKWGLMNEKGEPLI